MSGARSQEDAAPFFNPGKMKGKTCVDRKISGMFHRLPSTDMFRGVFFWLRHKGESMLRAQRCSVQNQALFIFEVPTPFATHFCVQRFL